MSLSYTADECRAFYRDSLCKQMAFDVLMDMNQDATKREMRNVLGLSKPKNSALRTNVINAIKRSKYPALYAHIVQVYGSMSVFCREKGIDRGTLSRLITGHKTYEQTRDIILERAGMTLDEARQEWNPCMEKDTAKA